MPLCAQQQRQLASVMPWRTGVWSSDTKERHSGATPPPANASPLIGSGRSQTITSTPARSHAAIVCAIVAAKV